MRPAHGASVVDQTGQPVQLGPLLGKGGEGSVFALANDATRVGKIYHDHSRLNVEKLTAMVRTSSSELVKIAAWPERTLHEPRGRRMVGFVMRRADGVNLSELLGPASRKSEFPDATYPFVVRTAVNLAKAFATTHAANAVVGDVKEVNEVVNRKAIVTLVDTDGFQIRDPQTGRLFNTLAVTPTHQPPELQGISDFSRITRTPDHDAFGLAVLIFQLLFMGRHPFTGVPVANRDLEIPEAIRLLQFSWAPALAHRLYRQPPATVSLDAVGPLAPLFIRAFLPGQSGGRPSAAEWTTALTTYERQLKRCTVNPSHGFVGGSCPLCPIEAVTSTLLFLGPLPTGTAAAFDLDLLWRGISKVASPGPAPTFPPVPVVAPVPAAMAVGRVRRRQRVAAVAVLVMGAVVFYGLLVATQFLMYWVLGVCAVLAWIVWAQGTAKADVYLTLRRVERERVEAARKQWQQATGDALFREKLRSLQASRDALRHLDAEKSARLRELRSNVRQHQLDRHLRSHRIAGARIPNIGPGRITTLRSYNIETAFDIAQNKLAYVHGFGPKLQGNLYQWRASVERTFRFDPSKGVDARDVRDLEREFATKRAQHEQLLRTGAAALAQLAMHALDQRRHLALHVSNVLADVAQAEANARAAT